MDALIIHTTDELPLLLNKGFDFTKISRIFLVSNHYDTSKVPNDIAAEIEYFDHFLTIEAQTEIDSQAMSLASSWYLSSNREDRSIYKDVSIGASMYSFFYDIFVLMLKYKNFATHILSGAFDKIYLSDMDNTLLECVLKHHLPPNSKLSKLKNDKPATEGLPSLPIYNHLQQIDLFFGRKTSIKNIALTFFYFFHRLIKQKPNNSILFFLAGKSDNFTKFLLSSSTNQLGFSLPLSASTITANRSISYYFHLPFLSIQKSKIDQAYNRLYNQQNNLPALDANLVQHAVQFALKKNFGGILIYIDECFRNLKKIRPETIMFAAETHPIHILTAAIAKSLGIKTIVTPHGWTTPSLPPDYFHSKNAPYDGAIAFSAEMKNEYIAGGVSEDRVFISPMEYFAKFLPVKSLPTKTGPYSNALLLPPDYLELYRLAFVEEGLSDIIQACNKLNIKKMAIKTRSTRQSQLIKSLNLDLKKLEIYTGYTELPVYAKEFDIVIGPPCSATLECLMLGIPYFTFLSQEGKVGFWNRSQIENSLFVAKNSAELANHIQHGLIFKEQKTIDDLLKISTFKSSDEISQSTIQLIQKF